MVVEVAFERADTTIINAGQGTTEVTTRPFPYITFL